MKSKVTWVRDMLFESENRQLTSQMDTIAEHGGTNDGPSPKEVVLNAMCACSGMDVVSIGKKMRIDVKKLVIEATAEATNTIPSYFASVNMKYVLEGTGESEKFINAVVLSMTKYCGVSFMISKVCPINYEIHLNGQKVHQDVAKFAVEVKI